MESSSAGILGPADELLLALVREGLRDAEIAVRLGLTIGEARSRVARLASRIGAEDRAGLLAWNPRLSGPIAAIEPAGAAADAEAPRTADGGRRPILRLPSSRGRPPLRSFAGVGAALVCALGGLWWIATADTPPAGGPPERTAASSMQAPPEAAAIEVAVVDGVRAVRVREGTPAALPGGLSVYVTPTCLIASECRGPSTLERVRSLGREVQRDTLQGSTTDNGFIRGVTVSGDGLVLGAVIDDGQDGRVMLSGDAGASWTPGPELPVRDLAPVGFIGQDLLLRTAGGRYYRAPSGQSFDPEMNGLPLGVDLHGQVLLWLGRELVRSNGTRIAQPRIPGYVEPLWAAELPDGSLAIGWRGGAGTATWTVAILDSTGVLRSALTGLSAPPAGFIDSGHALVVAEQFGRLPTILDLQTGVLDPIVGAFEAYKARDLAFLAGLLREGA